MKGLVAKLKVKLGLLDWSKKSHTSIPLVFIMKITPGLVGEKAPHVLWAPYVGAELKIGAL
jgi:hypothetical protein